MAYLECICGQEWTAAEVAAGEQFGHTCSASEQEKEIIRLEDALRKIQQWDCLNPPRADLLADLPWLKRLVDAALDGSTPSGEVKS